MAAHGGFQAGLGVAVVGTGYVGTVVAACLASVGHRVVGLEVNGEKLAALLGLAFKPCTDDLRDSPAVEIATALLRAGAVVSAHDPLVTAVPSCAGLKLVGDPYLEAERADAVVLMTEWPDYLALDLKQLRSRMRGDLVIDGRNLLKPAAVEGAGLSYQGIGRNKRTPASLTV